MSNQAIERKQNGQWAKGYSGNTDGAGGRARRELNAETIREMHRAFREHGRKAIDRVIKEQPAAFLKLLVLLVPREMQIEHSSGVKAMSDAQLEAGIEALTRMLEVRDAAAKVIEGTAGTVALPAADVVPGGSNRVMDAPDTAVGARKRKRGKSRVPSTAGT